MQKEQNKRHVETKSVEACIDTIIGDTLVFLNDKC